MLRTLFKNRIGTGPLTGGALLAMFAALAVAGSAIAASVLIYENDFSSRGEYKQVKKFDGGKPCVSSHRDKKAFEVLVKRGVRTCVYRTRVENDTPRGNLDISAKAKLTNATQKGTRKQAYVGLGLRFSKSHGYLARVFPNKGSWKLSRVPDSGEFPISGESGKIRPVGKANQLRLRVKGSKINLWVNGTKLASGVSDSDPKSVKGTKSVLLIGNSQKTGKDVVGFFDNLKVRIP